MVSKYMHDDCLRACAWLEAQDPELTKSLKEALRTGAGVTLGTPAYELDKKLQALNDVASSWSCNEPPSLKGSLKLARDVISQMEVAQRTTSFA
jgi:hypothetical protein